MTRMPGPVQEVFYHLDLEEALFIRVHGNQDDITHYTQTSLTLLHV